jgi:hypothetical protein
LQPDVAPDAICYYLFNSLRLGQDDEVRTKSRKLANINCSVIFFGIQSHLLSSTSGGQHGDLGQVIRQFWKALTDEERNEWKEKLMRIRAVFRALQPGDEEDLGSEKLNDARREVLRLLSESRYINVGLRLSNHSTLLVSSLRRSLLYANCDKRMRRQYDASLAVGRSFSPSVFTDT